MRSPGLALLAFAALFGTGAGDYGPDPADGTSSFVGTGAFGDYLQGRFAAQEADLSVAADRLEAVLTLEPGVPDVATQAFIASVLAGRPDAVRMAASLPDNPVARLLLSNWEAKAGRWRNAAHGFDTLPGGSSMVRALQPLLVAWAQLGDDRPGDAVTTLQTAMATGQNRPVLILHQALVTDLAGRAEEAGRLYRAARSEYGGLNLRLGQMLASWAARTGDLAGAEAIDAGLAAADGELAMVHAGGAGTGPAVRNPADGLAEVYLAMAGAVRQQNAPDLAQVLLRLALDMRPDFTPARLLLAEIQEGAKQSEGALETLAAVDEADPLAPVVVLRRAALQDALDQGGAAVSALEALAAQHPDRPEPLAVLGDILRRRNRMTEAVPAYDRAVARIATPSRANWALFYERGIALERAGQWPRAEADFLFALELSPDQPGVLNYLGYAWADQHRNLDRARTMIERAVQLRPEDGSYIDSLGWVMLLQGDLPGALRNLERAVSLMPEDSTINAHLGDALFAAGRKREAGFQWRRALNLQPEPAESERIQAKLRDVQDGPDAGTPPTVP